MYDSEDELEYIEDDNFTEEQTNIIWRKMSIARALTVCETILVLLTLAFNIMFASIGNVAFLVAGIIATVLMVVILVVYIVVMIKLKKYMSSIQNTPTIQNPNTDQEQIMSILQELAKSQALDLNQVLADETKKKSQSKPKSTRSQK